MKSGLFFFFIRCLCFWCHTQCHKSVPYIFFSKSLVVFALVFGPSIHFEFTLAYGVRKDSNFTSWLSIEPFSFLRPRLAPGSSGGFWAGPGSLSCGPRHCWTCARGSPAWVPPGCSPGVHRAHDPLVLSGVSAWPACGTGWLCVRVWGLECFSLSPRSSESFLYPHSPSLLLRSSLHLLPAQRWSSLHLPPTPAQTSVSRSHHLHPLPKAPPAPVPPSPPAGGVCRWAQRWTQPTLGCV